jgi:hypothetical protein
MGGMSNHLHYRQFTIASGVICRRRWSNLLTDNISKRDVQFAALQGKILFN